MTYIAIYGEVKCKVFCDFTACRLINTVVIGSSKIRSVVMFSGKRTQWCVRCPLYLNVISLIRFCVLVAVHVRVLMSFRGTSRTSRTACLPTHIPENKKRDSRDCAFTSSRTHSQQNFSYPRHECIWGNRGIAPLILTLGNRGRWVVITLRPPYPRERTQAPT